MAAIDPDLLLRAYAIGVFPMSDGREAKDVYWVEPRRRAILPLDGFHLSRSLKKTIRSDRFTVTRDTAFAEVIRACAERDETWINPAIEQSYTTLHALGQAHSIETWFDGELVGGLYGVRLGPAFFGESMFSRATDASKVALAWLVARLIAGGYRLLDCQFMTDHLKSLGAIEVTQQRYLEMLTAELEAAGSFDSPPVSSVRRGGVEEADFGKLDRLLEDAAGASGAAGAPGCVIAQLLTQTS
ncbi:leucyl/phenylalanyl-tRNA--protein transferase [Sphingosinicella sp. YJ22]|uniref:leucyl/phenylalanyl-tRNA--protein transferase n=1 Tax=Sphingosinicella sp. YJ22 TaxID=1104780 RepID=UPI00140DEAC7|nr:leucyl/phenylalanyl-tRNA--protein transferase [Sphingosinicella sp. YJ22]